MRWRGDILYVCGGSRGARTDAGSWDGVQCLIFFEVVLRGKRTKINWRWKKIKQNLLNEYKFNFQERSRSKKVMWNKSLEWVLMSVKSIIIVKKTTKNGDWRNLETRIRITGQLPARILLKLLKNQLPRSDVFSNFFQCLELILVTKNWSIVVIHRSLILKIQLCNE